MPGLTEKAISAARVKDGELFLWDRGDGAVTGLFCRVKPSGVKTFGVQYRVGARTRRVRIGQWPVVKVEKARKEAHKLMGEIGDGGDPSDRKRRERRLLEQMVGDTVAAIGEQFIAKHASQRRWRELERVMRHDLIPNWGKRPVAEITRRDVIELLDTIAERAPIQANRTLTVLSIFFGWCVDRDIIPADPTARVRKPTKEPKRDRILSDAELRAFWLGCDRLGWPFGPLLQLLALTAQRKSEIGELRWSEIKDGGRLIELSGERYKTGRPHIVPLSDAARAIIGGLPRIGEEPDLVFTTTIKTAVSGYSKAKAELDGYMLEEMRRGALEPNKVTLAPWKIHDLRRTARSALSRLGIRPDIGERVLGHVIGGVRGVYDLYSFEPEMRRALDAWAAHIQGIVTAMTPASNVVVLRDAS